MINQVKYCIGLSQCVKLQRLSLACMSLSVNNARNFSCLTHDKSYKSNYVNENLNKIGTRIELKNSYHTEDSGIFKYLSDSAPVEVAQKLLVTIHDTTGLPWWGSIIFTTVLLRSTITLPLAIYQNYIMAKLENLHREMPAIAKELKMETVYAMKQLNWTEKQAKMMFDRSLKKQWDKLIVRDNCHPLKGTLLLWIQIPMWISFSVALRNLASMLPKADLEAQIIYSQLTVGGFLWMPNLIDVDHSLILPIALGVFNLAVTEIHVMSRIKQQTRLQRYITNFIRFVSICMVPIAAYVPSALCLYWTTSSIFGLGQNLVLLSPKVKRLFKVPITNTEINKPYEHLLLQIGQRFAVFKKK